MRNKENDGDSLNYLNKYRKQNRTCFINTHLEKKKAIT